MSELIYDKYDTGGALHHEWYRKNIPWYKSLVDVIMDFVDEDKQRILDLGCGDGLVCKLLSEKGHPSFTKRGKENKLWKYGSRGSSTWNEWRNKVLKRDSYTCKHCGGKEMLIAHHIKDYRKYPELKFEVSNGLTLCRRCHPLYHPELINNLH